MITVFSMYQLWIRTKVVWMTSRLLTSQLYNRYIYYKNLLSVVYNLILLISFNLLSGIPSSHYNHQSERRQNSRNWWMTIGWILFPINKSKLSALLKAPRVSVPQSDVDNLSQTTSHVASGCCVPCMPDLRKNKRFKRIF